MYPLNWPQELRLYSWFWCESYCLFDIYIIKKHCLRHFHDLKHGVIVYKHCKIVNTFIHFNTIYLYIAPFKNPMTPYIMLRDTDIQSGYYKMNR